MNRQGMSECDCYFALYGIHGIAVAQERFNSNACFEIYTVRVWSRDSKVNNGRLYLKWKSMGIYPVKLLFGKVYKLDKGLL